MTFHGKLQFENGGAPLERDNFAFCKVMTNLVVGRGKGYICPFSSNLFASPRVELCHDELGDNSKTLFDFRILQVIQSSCPVVPLTCLGNVERAFPFLSLFLPSPFPVIMYVNFASCPFFTGS